MRGVRILGSACLIMAACGDDAPGDIEPDARVADAGAHDASADDATSIFDAAAATLLDAGLRDAGFVNEPDTSFPDRGDAAALPYARAVVSFEPGPHAGYGSDSLPDVVLGPPRGKGNLQGSLDVLSLGVGGAIVIDFGARTILDGPGADFIVFENAFWPSGDVASVFAELGEVSTSNDGTTWSTFPCSTKPTAPGMWPGCAGFTPTLAYDPFSVLPLDPALTGGDAFDLASVGATGARYVRIRDLSTTGEATNAGFDLDAVGIIHASE